MVLCVVVADLEKHGSVSKVLVNELARDLNSFHLRRIVIDVVAYVVACNQEDVWLAEGVTESLEHDVD